MCRQSERVIEILTRIINKASSLMTEPHHFGIDDVFICLRNTHAGCHRQKSGY